MVISAAVWTVSICRCCSAEKWSDDSAVGSAPHACSVPNSMARPMHSALVRFHSSHRSIRI